MTVKWGSDPKTIGTHDIGWYTVDKRTAGCKHGTGSCEICGTTIRRDHTHKTEGGTGTVGRMIKKRK